ncbi:nuclear-interacting partner of ALK [Pelobates cultripes]|uniref:Nuclear-interacting partner of ALK n=2 Tax=Pelobates cultripes TaxID=61616 RepID=A0AAD1RP28_PELCU|nr:nuclear-interacting partner of ALK [Pelobates cultripes]
MAAPSAENVEVPLKSPAGTPGKVRKLINEGIVSADTEARKETVASTDENNGFEAGSDSASSETTSRDAFFSRVESFTSVKWAGKPPELSPLLCAKYGWLNVECDMLKCSSCSAYLCAGLQPSMDFSSYKERCLELQEALRTGHKEFCFWPDSPCPEHFWALMVTEPSSVLNNFVEHFQNLCKLELQLPSLKSEDLKNMDLTEDTVSLLLHLIDDELKAKEGRENLARSVVSDSLHVHISACILALCGWNCSPTHSSSLSIIGCTRCMRKVGLWGFLQLETMEMETSPMTPGTPVSPVEGQNDRTPLGSMSSNRRVTRSREPEQSPSSLYTRTRSWDFSSPADSDAVRSRPVTRSMGQGENTGLGADTHSSPHRKPKRPRLCSSSSSDTSPRGYFDPLSQHRTWCPWVSVYKNATNLERSKNDSVENGKIVECGWKEVLKVLMVDVKSRALADQDSSTVPEKSYKVFRIFRQWQRTTSS